MGYHLYKSIKIGELIDLLHQAGQAIIDIYNQNFIVELKADSTPITLADQHSNDILTRGLYDCYPDIPVISEENEPVPFKQRKDWDCFWLLDPLDGTREFIKRNGEFAINLALIEHKQPVLGMIYIPVSKTLYYASLGKGCFKITGNSEPLFLKTSAGKNQQDRVIVAGSRSHLSAEVYTFVEKLRREYREVELIQMGSAIKFGLIAEGRADFYLRTGRTMEWDTAAGQVIVGEVGKQIYDYKTGHPLIYNKKDLTNPWFIVR
jgi:3'(2'), 5'-bisphosphate nucleotidase